MSTRQRATTSFNLSPTWLALTFPQQTMASLSPLFNHFLTYPKYSLSHTHTHTHTHSRRHTLLHAQAHIWTQISASYIYGNAHARMHVSANADAHSQPKKGEKAAISRVWYHPEDARAELKCGTCLWCESRAWACNKRRYQITPCPALISKTPCLLLQR